MPGSVKQDERFATLMVRDAERLRTQARRARSLRDRAARERAEADLADAVARAERRVAARASLVPVLRYPEDLPVSAHREELLRVLREHQVVVVAGETGSGKSTQLPKLCLETGRGVRGLIGHTQPRRLAARAVAARVAEELGSELGDTVGFTVRFTDRVGERTLVKVMTDGILLAEIQRDRLLTAYDTIIVDEAHERSLNVDFLLGYLKEILPERPDLQVVITSATIDTARFSAHFGDAPVVEVSGRSFPVEIRYRPLVDEDSERDQLQGVVDAVTELLAAGSGDILVFLSGEREIRDAADALRRAHGSGLELLPLYARLSLAEQQRVFAPHPGRRVVLATNVAETSITVPGIRFVVDPGTARISRYNRRTKVQRLPIEAVSQASADQRAGRCGRVAPGVCIRLYAEDDYAARPRFTDPEILRTNLASVILQMAALGLGDVAAFPFVDPPDRRAVADGVALLEELGALDPAQADPRRRLTPLGRRLARLPLDPRLGRMVLEADRNGCVREVMVIAAALSIQDPRERPAGREQQAAELHGRFRHADSDFLTWVALWDHLRRQQKELSGNQFRRLCRRELLNYVRVREWQDIYSQLRQVCRDIGVRVSSAPDQADLVHLSVLPGLLSHVGMKDPAKPEYRGARNTRFAVAPGSVLFKKGGRWVMAAELVETNRLWARTVARIQPQWLERTGAHLLRWTHSEPEWDRERASATVVERASLFGLPVVAGRRAPFARVDRPGARAMFIRNALVEGDWEADHPFLAGNEALRRRVRALEDRVRRRDLLVDDEALVAFFDARLPADVTSGPQFDRWWNRQSRDTPELLTHRVADLVRPGVTGVSLEAFPDTWAVGSHDLSLSYVFAPWEDDDGVTVHVPLRLLPSLDPAPFAWHVSGLREEVVTALVRSLPKAQRRTLVPIPDHVDAFLAAHGPDDGALLPLLAAHLGRAAGTPIGTADFDLARLPPYLRPRFAVEDDHGRCLASGRDLRALQVAMRARIQAAVRVVGAEHEQSGRTGWCFGDIPRTVERVVAGHRLVGYPALVDEGNTVGVRITANPVEQDTHMRAGTARLLRLGTRSPKKHLPKLLPRTAVLALTQSPYPSASALLEDCILAAIDALVEEAGGPAWTADGFRQLRDQVNGELVSRSEQVARRAAELVQQAQAVEAHAARLDAPALAGGVDDVVVHLARLMRDGFVRRAGARRLPDLGRYLAALDRRLDRLARDPGGDRVRARRLRALEQRYDAALHQLVAERAADAEAVGWMLEELRVSLFAQGIGTAFPISEERVLRAIAALEG